jgi:hypothetical protein
MSAEIETTHAEPATATTVGAPTMAAEPFPWRQWAAVLAGGVAGFGLTVVLCTLGLAVGITSDAGASRELAVGSAIWWILTAAIVGIFAGALVGAMVSPQSTLATVSLAFLTWTTGTIILLLMLSLGAGTFLGGMGSYMSAVAQDPTVGINPAQTERAQTITAAALWVLFASQLVGIGLTIVGIGLGRKMRRNAMMEASRA